MAKTDQTVLPVMGSAFRRGRDDAAYQADRLGKLLDFSAWLIDVYSRQLHLEQRRGRQVWQGKLWNEQRADALDQAVAEVNKVAEERAGWISKLEATSREQADWIAKLEEAKVYLNGQIESLQQQAEAEARHRGEVQAYIDRIRNKWWCRLAEWIGLVKRPNNESRPQ